MECSDVLLVLTERWNGGIPAICGFATRDFVHRNSLRHLTVQLVPVLLDHIRNEPVVVLHRRSALKTTAGKKLDICGGHVTYDPLFFPRHRWESRNLLKAASLRTALREAREEIQCKPSTIFTAKHLISFGELCEFECSSRRTDGTYNREYSSVYLIGIPTDSEVSIWDSDRGGERKLKHVCLTLQELLNVYKKDRGDFADGVTRVLDSVIASPRRVAELQRLMASTCQAVQKMKARTQYHSKGVLQKIDARRQRKSGSGKAASRSKSEK